MRAHIQFLTTPTADTPGTTLVLHFDNRRYVFGRISEGTQRAFLERAIGMKKLGAAFVTGRCCWENIGGLIGMTLTLADTVANMKEALELARAKKEEKLAARAANEISTSATREPLDEQEQLSLNIYGPPNLVHSIACARRFVFRKGLPLNVEDVREKPGAAESKPMTQPMYVDENIKVWSMSVKPQNHERQQMGGPSPTSRKRSFDDMNDVEQTNSLGSHIALNSDADEISYQLDKAVLAAMFGSTWNLDTLEETHISEVKLPARIWVRDPDTRQLKEYAGPLPGGLEPVPDIKVFVRKPWPGALIKSVPPVRPRDEAVSYIVGMHPRRGKFDREKAIKLGIKPGPDFRKLTEGESVVLADGRSVTPDMVLGAERQGAGIAIIDIPSHEYLDPIIMRGEWKDETVMLGVSSVVWILGPGVAAELSLRKFMEETPHLKHIVSSPDHCPNELAFDRAATSAFQLAQIDKACFPEPYFDNSTLPQKTFRRYHHELIPLPPDVAVAKRGLIIELEPKYVLRTDSNVPHLDVEKVVGSTDLEMLRLAHEAYEQEDTDISAKAWKSNCPVQDAEVITLGTGSAMPSISRNVSATLVRVPGWGSYMLDCGEGTLGQLQRVFTPDEMVQLLKDLRFIWISHLHADHHLGTVSLIKAWHEIVHGSNSTTPVVCPELFDKIHRDISSNAGDLGRPPYLAVISDIQMMHYLSEYASVEDYGYSHILPLAIFSVNPTKPERKHTLTLNHHDCPVQEVPSSLYGPLLGIESIYSVDVKHCHGAKGVAITWPPAAVSHSGSQNEHADGNFKIAYSGDCRPSSNLARIGLDATVLIHEATFDDDLAGEARAKNHSTTSEALRIGALMRARATLLTHFSQRYSKIPGASWAGVESSNVGEAEARDWEDRILQQTEQALREEEEQQGGHLNPDLPSWGEVGKQLTSPDEIPLFDESLGSKDEGTMMLGSSGKETDGTKDENMDHGSPAIARPLPAILNSQDPAPSHQVSPNGTTSPTAPNNIDAPLADAIFESQRATNNSLPAFRPSDMRVAVAFDYMRVRMRDLPRMQRFRPALVRLFEDLERDAGSCGEVDAGAENGAAGVEDGSRPHQQQQQQQAGKKSKKDKKRERKAEQMVA